MLKRIFVLSLAWHMEGRRRDDAWPWELRTAYAGVARAYSAYSSALSCSEVVAGKRTSSMEWKAYCEAVQIKHSIRQNTTTK